MKKLIAQQKGRSYGENIWRKRWNPVKGNVDTLPFIHKVEV